MLPSNILLTAYGAWIISEDATRFRRKVPIRNILIRRHATFPNQKSVKYFDKRLTSEKECCSTLFFFHRRKTRDENLEIYEWKSFSVDRGRTNTSGVDDKTSRISAAHSLHLHFGHVLYIYLSIYLVSVSVLIFYFILLCLSLSTFISFRTFAISFSCSISLLSSITLCFFLLHIHLQFLSKPFTFSIGLFLFLSFSQSLYLSLIISR